jgi:hypothetical protein
MSAFALESRNDVRSEADFPSKLALCKLSATKQLICKSRDSIIAFFSPSHSCSCLLLRILHLFCPLGDSFFPSARTVGRECSAMHTAMCFISLQLCGSRLDHVVLHSTISKTSIRLVAYFVPGQTRTRSFISPFICIPRDKARPSLLHIAIAALSVQSTRAHSPSLNKQVSIDCI